MSLRRVFACALPVLLATVVTHSRAVAADLAIGIGADVTAIDPHYHNVTPNNNVAAHIFDYLVLRDERQKPIPGLAESWKNIDPLTWEFKLRKGVKFHDGADFTPPTWWPPLTVCRRFRTARPRSLCTPSRSKK